MKGFTHRGYEGKRNNSSHIKEVTNAMEMKYNTLNK